MHAQIMPGYSKTLSSTLCHTNDTNEVYSYIATAAQYTV